MELMRFLDDDPYLVHRERRIPPIGVDLDQVRALSDLLANSPPGIFHAAHLGACQQIRQWNSSG
jgi:hypothetical protein